MKFLPAAILSVLTMMAPARAAERVAAPAADNARFAMFEREVAAFARPNAIEQKTTLFVGSSSVRLWDVAASFPGLHAINRGFGGATTADVLHFYPQLIAGTAPVAIVVYVGENDIASGETPENVSAGILTLLGQLHRDMPGARIAYLSMKPTPLRWAMFPRMATVNAAISAQAVAGGGFDYLDVASALLTAQGVPGEEYFGPDRLHMSMRGYARWTEVVDAWLRRETPRPQQAPLQASTS